MVDACASVGSKTDRADVFKRETSHRIFVNRSLQLDKIKFFGFDMDYTLAQYLSPQYEKLSFRLILERLVDVGYPADILQFEYDHSVPIRGLWFDKEKGFLLKVDTFGNILSCLHGLEFVPAGELRRHYDNKFVLLSSRFHVYDTLFNLPEIYCLASLVEFFKAACGAASDERRGFTYNDALISYRSLFSDVREATNFIHDQGGLKRLTVERIADYVAKDPLLADLLRQLSASGAKVFLLTNSGFAYTDRLMTFLLGGDWRDAFDYVLVDACKPRFFAEGGLLRVVEPATGRLKLGHHTGPLQRGAVYSGGSSASLSQLIGCRGKDVLYVGDHIFGDIVKSKKVGWRTLLIVPELPNELYVWKREQSMYEQLQSLDIGMSRLYQHCTMGEAGSDSLAAEMRDMKLQIRNTVQSMDAAYGFMGSLFRFGGRLTSFASQLERYADLYSQSVTNLLYYPGNYMFRAPAMLMPHESTVARSDSPPERISAGAKLALRATHSTDKVGKTSAPNIADIQMVAKRQESVSGIDTNSPASDRHEESTEDSSFGELLIGGVSSVGADDGGTDGAAGGGGGGATTLHD